MTVRLDILRIATKAIRDDLKHWNISGRKAAKQLGLSNSTFNAFLNCEYNTQHRATLEKLLVCSIWSEVTRTHLNTLLNYESLAFSGKIMPPRLQVVEGGKQVLRATVK